MHKKSVMFLFLSILLLSSIHDQSGFQSVTAQSSSGSNTVRMVGLDLQLKQNGTDYFTTVNNSLSAKLASAVNNTIARFVASFVNENTTSPIQLNEFDVYLFNSTTITVPTQTLTQTFGTTDADKIDIPVNGSYTNVFETGLPFTLNSLTGEQFQIQYSFTYAYTSNLTNTYNLKSPFNFTVNSIVPPYSPPEFIVWTWWLINAAIVVLFAIGMYGNRKVKRQNANKK